MMNSRGCNYAVSEVSGRCFRRAFLLLKLPRPGSNLRTGGENAESRKVRARRLSTASRAALGGDHLRIGMGRAQGYVERAYRRHSWGDRPFRKGRNRIKSQSRFPHALRQEPAWRQDSK